MPTCSQNLASPPSTTVSPAARTGISAASSSDSTPSSASSRSSSDVHRFVLEVLVRLIEFGGGLRRGGRIDFRGGDDLVDRRHHAVPAAGDDLADPCPSACVPARPVNWSMPPETSPRLGLPLKNRVTAGRSHTEPIEDTTARVSASEPRPRPRSASRPATPPRRSGRRGGPRPARSRWALALASRSQAGWSTRSLSVSVRTNAARSATDSKAKRSSSLPRKASHSSPPSRQRGAHKV